MQARSGDSVTAASHGDAVGIFDFENGRCGDLAVRGDAVHQTLRMTSQTKPTGQTPPGMYMRQHSSWKIDAGFHGTASVASDSSHRMSGEIGIELSPATCLSNDVEMKGHDSHLDQGQWSPSQRDGQRPSDFPKQVSGRANSMAQSITRFFRRAKPVCEVRRVDVAHTNATEAKPSTRLSRKRGLGHLQTPSCPPPRSTTPSCYGLVAEADQPNPAKRIPGMFKAKRMLDAQSDSSKSMNNVKRPTLATTVFAGRSPRILLSEHAQENYMASSTLQSVFDMADACGEFETGHMQLMPHVASPASPAGSSGMLPCGMAPHVTSPIASRNVEARDKQLKLGRGCLPLRIPDVCTPDQANAGGRFHSDFALESVHTPPEVTLSAVLECPGAPLKKKADTDTIEVLSRLSSLSFDSIDMCGSPFAPGAPTWSPRAEVRRALRFD